MREVSNPSVQVMQEVLVSPKGMSVGLCLAGAAQSSPVENSWDGVSEGSSWQPLCLMGAVCVWCPLAHLWSPGEED